MELEKWKLKGRIFDIQRFSVHDGPGIRTIVFLKGCPLRCHWCCNPESQHHEIETMLINGKEKIMGRDVTVQEVMDEVWKDRPYYRRSGGGITLSGGECLFQAEFSATLLQSCIEDGINTAIETTGYAPYDRLAMLLPWVDTVMMDIKQVDDKKHQEFTGKSNRLILENAQKIAQKGNNLIIRVPVIPTFNDTEGEIAAIAAFADSLPNVKRIHLLPYHRLGEDKYKGLRRRYLMEGIGTPENDHMERLRQVVLDKTRLQCQIGG